MKRNTDEKHPLEHMARKGVYFAFMLFFCGMGVIPTPVGCYVHGRTL